MLIDHHAITEVKEYISAFKISIINKTAPTCNNIIRVTNKIPLRIPLFIDCRIIPVLRITPIMLKVHQKVSSKGTFGAKK